MKRLLDVCCCAGGTSKGYSDAGFEVVGLDISPQPNYPFTFIQADALEVLEDHAFLADFDAIGASPPCRDHTALTSVAGFDGTAWLLGAVRDRLLETGKPYVIENVMPAPLDKKRSVVMCGEMFGLRTIRHRRFEPSPGLTLTAPAHPRHTARTATKRRREMWDQGWHVSVTGDVGTYVGPEALGIDWMSGNELCQAIPPAYTRHIGLQLLAVLAGKPAADQSPSLFEVAS